MDGAEEERGEFGPGLGDQRDAVAGLDPGGDQAIGGETRVVAQLAVAVGAHEAPARIVEIEPAAALRRIVERLADGGEVGEAARLRAEGGGGGKDDLVRCRSEEHTSELQSLMRISYAVFCLKQKKTTTRK